MRNLLILCLFVVAMAALQGCAVLWTAEKAAGAAWFATKTTAKAGAKAAEVTWDAGSAAVDAASGDEGENREEKENRAGDSRGD